MLKTSPLQMMDIEPSVYERAMNKLVVELKIEEGAGRYSPEIGFYEYVFNFSPYILHVYRLIPSDIFTSK